MPRPRTRSSSSAPSKRSGGATGRSMWTGQLRLALVSVPVQLYPAVTSGARLSFHQIDSKSGKRIRYEKVAPGIGPVEAENIVKGYEISKGNYVLITDEEMDHVKIEARRTIDLIQFVDHCEIDPIYFDKPYYVVPDGELAEEAYGVMRDALRATNKMGLGQFVMRGREYVAALKPCGAGLMLETLRFADEVREAAPLFAELGDETPNEELLDLAKELIKRKVAKFEAEKFHDRYTEALREMIDAKAKHQPVGVDDDEAPSRNNVIDLVEALRRSVRDNAAAEPAQAAPPRQDNAPADGEAAAPKAKAGAAKKPSKTDAKPAPKAAKRAGSRR